MKKKIVLRCLLGASVGFIISFLITLIISACIGKGKYYPVHPQLTALCGNELNAVILQTACSLLYGAAFAGASVIWELEGWSLLKQTVVHCLIVSAASFPIAFFMYWMPHTFLGIAGYILGELHSSVDIRKTVGASEVCYIYKRIESTVKLLLPRSVNVLNKVAVSLIVSHDNGNSAV